MSQVITPTGDLKLEFKGASAQVNFRHAVSKGENSYWAVLAVKGNGERYNSPYGVKVQRKSLGLTAPGLPTSLSIIDPESGKKITVELKADAAEGRAKKRFSGKVTLPNGVERMLHASISETQDAQVQLKVSAVGIGGSAARPGIDATDL